MDRLRKRIEGAFLGLACAAVAVLALAGCAGPEPARAPRSAARPARQPVLQARVPGPAPAPPRRSVPPGAWEREANKWLGTPHRLGGLDRGGIDCSGFTRQVCQAVAGITLPHNSAQQFACGAPVSAAALRAGDLVFFREPGKGISHVGLSLGGERFIHASTRRGVVVSSLRETYYAGRFCGAKRLAP